jgi:hypothetical protein
MADLVNEYEEQLKKMSKQEKDLFIARLLKQKEQSKKRAKDVAAEKRAAGFRTLSVEVSKEQMEEFKDLLLLTKLDRAELLAEMMKSYRTRLTSEKDILVMVGK